MNYSVRLAYESLRLVKYKGYARMLNGYYAIIRNVQAEKSNLNGIYFKSTIDSPRRHGEHREKILLLCRYIAAEHSSLINFQLKLIKGKLRINL